MAKSIASALGFIVLSLVSFYDVQAAESALIQRDTYQQNYSEYQEANPETAVDDEEIVKAVERRRRLDYVEGAGMVVVKLLPDDRSGLEHQKWVVRLSNGSTMQAVYNLDLCEYVQLKIGDTISMGGQFIWTNEGAMLHWLHYDPRQNRPDGYVEVNGKVYCKDGERHR